MQLKVPGVNGATAEILTILARQKNQKRAEYIRDMLDLIAEEALTFWEREGYNPKPHTTEQLRRRQAFERLEG